MTQFVRALVLGLSAALYLYAAPAVPEHDAGAPRTVALGHGIR